MELRVLGPVAVVTGRGPVSLGGPKPRALLAALVLNAGRVVAADTLITALWGETPPSSARAMVHTYVSALRKVLAAGGRPGDRELLVRRPPGYLLTPGGGSTDLAGFEQAVAAGRQALDAGDTELAAVTVRRALALWTGSALDGVDGEWAVRQRARLAESWFGALELRLEADFRLGRGRELVGELTALVAEHPLREHLRARLMFALHEAGRQADAVASFHEARRFLVGELGVEPGQELQSAFRRVLVHEEAVTVGKPAVLPPSIADFTGRSAQVGELLELLGPAAGTGAVRACAISGKTGSGKTALAVHVAHRLRDEYADGQLYACLNGTRSAPADPSDVLARFLRILGAEVPAGFDDRVDRYRSLLAGRRVLVVLDDVAGPRQAIPLIPPGAGCAVLLTSRVRMPTVAAGRLVDLGEFSEEESRTMIARQIGETRLAAEPAAVRELLRRCGHLPLALRIAGAKLAAHPHWTIGELVRRLERRPLDELTIGDLSLPGSLDLSYGKLTEPERAALRGLGRAGEREFTGRLAAVRLELPQAAAEDVLERLVEARLLDVVGLDAAGATRYGFDSLTAVFARQLENSASPERVYAA